MTWMTAGTSVPCTKDPAGWESAAAAATRVGVVRACTSTTSLPDALPCLSSATYTPPPVFEHIVLVSLLLLLL